MIIGLTTLLFDINGAMDIDILLDKSQFDHVSRRAERTAILNGLSALVDNGSTASDATFSLKFIPESVVEHDQLLTIVKNHSLVNISMRGGFFKGVITDVTGLSPVAIRFLVIEQLA